MTTENNNSVSGDGDACIAWDNRTMCLSEQLQHISCSAPESDSASRELLIWITMPRWRRRKVYPSINHRVFSSSFLGAGESSLCLCHGRSLTKQQHSERPKPRQCLIRLLIRELAVHSNILHGWPFESTLSHLSCSRLRGVGLEVSGIRHY